MIGYDPAPLAEGPPKALNFAASSHWVRRIVTTVNSTLQGKMNAVLPVTLAASAATTTVIDARISAFSSLTFSPITAHAAAEIPTLYVQSQTSGQAVLAHTNNAEADRNFNMTIIG